MKLLIVDDMVENLYMLESLLKGSGYEVVSAENGVEALEMLRSDSIDMIISDILMPGMDGFQLCRECKKDGTLRKIPFIFYTATYTEHKDEEFALSLGAERFIIKATEPELFLEIIKDVVKEYEKGIPAPSKILVEKEDAAYLMEHNERLRNKLEDKLVELENTNNTLRESKEELRKRSHDLEERIKELHCLYGITSLVEKTDISYEELIQGIVNLLPPAWQYPEITCARIILEDREFKTDNLKETIWNQTSDIIADGKEIGVVEVFYLEERPEMGEGPFMKEETELINACAERLGRIIERIRTAEKEERLQAQLQQAQKMEAIGTLAGGIAHDFNNILSIVLGYTELALGVCDKDSSLESNLQAVYGAGKRARDLTRQILTFSRQTEHELRPVQVKLIVKEALKLLRSSLPTTIEIRQVVQSDSTIMADSTEIHRVLMNLCTNAGHAMQKDGGILEVSLVNVEVDADFAARHLEISPGPHLKLTVSDTGYGIEPVIMERIFDPYFTTKEKGEGTGMGLSVVNGIVKSHGGAITVYSEPGNGSAFSLFLPVVKDVAEAERENKEALPEGDERILFVDDESTLVDVGTQTLGRLGYDVVGTTSSLEALELFKSEPQGFDLVITDTTMPQMTGDILAKEIMKIRPDIPIILCTGYSERVSKERAEELGIKTFAMKPLLMRDLATTVREVLDGGIGDC